MFRKFISSWGIFYKEENGKKRTFLKNRFWMVRDTVLSNGIIQPPKVIKMKLVVKCLFSIFCDFLRMEANGILWTYFGKLLWVPLPLRKSLFRRDLEVGFLIKFFNLYFGYFLKTGWMIFLEAYYKHLLSVDVSETITSSYNRFHRDVSSFTTCSAYLQSEANIYNNKADRLIA